MRGPHLVELLDADVDADLPYLVTRFVPGHAAGRAWSPSTARCEPGALPDGRPAGSPTRSRRCTRAGVVHRDLTPGNVLLLDGSPQLIDLGLATAADVTAHDRAAALVHRHARLPLARAGHRRRGHARGRRARLGRDGRLRGHRAGRRTARAGRRPCSTGSCTRSPTSTGCPADLRRLVEAAHRPGRPAGGRRPAGEPAGRGSERSVLRDVDPRRVRLPRDVDATTLLAAGGGLGSGVRGGAAYDARCPWRAAARRRRRLQVVVDRAAGARGGR